MDEDQDQTQEGADPSQTPGVEDAGDADPQGQGSDQTPDPGTDGSDQGSVDPKAFAARLKSERERIRAEERAAAQAEARASQPAAPAQVPVTVEAYAAQIAEQIGVTPEAAHVMATIAIRQQALERQQQQIAEQAEDAALRASDKTFDRTAADAVRADFAKRYGVNLSLTDAWKMARNQQSLAQSTRAAEQRALAQTDANRRAGTSAPAGGGGKPSVAELPKDDFEAMVRRVKAGGRVAG